MSANKFLSFAQVRFVALIIFSFLLRRRPDRIFFAIALLFISFIAKSQQATFQDSVWVAFQNTKQVRVVAVGDGFRYEWTKIAPSSQEKIITQARIIKKKGGNLFKHSLPYYEAVVAISRQMPSDMEAFLALMDDVLASNYSLNQMAVCCGRLQTFYQHHALVWDNKSLGIKIASAQARLSYRKPPPGSAVATESAEVNWADTLKTATVPSQLYGPVIEFDEATLYFVTPKDSSGLRDTKGVYSLINTTFQGQGGVFDWSSAGKPADSVFYTFQQYSFAVTSPIVKARKGKLTYVGRLKEPIEGSFTYDFRVQTAERNTYPRFVADRADVELIGLHPSLKYTGGFALYGKFEKSQALQRPATLEWSGRENRKFKVTAKLFSFFDTRVTADHASIVIYHDKDSITHRAVRVSFDYEKNKLLLLKDKSPQGNAPYVASLYRISFNANEVEWPVNSDSIKFYIKGSAKVSPMVFESDDFYHSDDYRIMSGMGFPFHPLTLVTSYAEKNNTRDFYMNEIIPYSGSDYAKVLMAMQFLSQKGMIDFNPHNMRIHVSDKAMLWSKVAVGNTDYDNLKIHSYEDGRPHAVLDLSKQEISVDGVTEFNVSNLLRVGIVPDSARIIFLPNRGIKFNGKMTAGNFEFYGKEFSFDYQQFSIFMKKIDSIRVHVETQNGRTLVQNTLVGVSEETLAAEDSIGENRSLENFAKANLSTGTVYISSLKNKAGLQKDPSYPRMEVTGEEYIFFDKKNILNGAYDRSVYFQVSPFEKHGLAATNENAAFFKGYFYTSGMFPAFLENLSVQEDLSMGFNHQVPPAGYPLYRTSGRLFGNINLDSRGLRSKGRIEYLTSKFASDDFVFYLDSISGKGVNAQVKEGEVNGITFPEVKISQYAMRWKTKQDSMIIKGIGKTPFSLYNGTGMMKGKLILSAGGLHGAGQFAIRGADIISSQMSFERASLSAAHARFRIVSEDKSKAAIDGKDVRVRFDLAQKRAEIFPEKQKEAALSFPYSQFKTSISAATLDLEKQNVEMRSEGDIENTYFYATKKELDSLAFNAERAVYDINKKELKISGIPYITVADARITPNEGKLTIQKDADLGTLLNCTIVLDTINAYHKLTQGEVQIHSRQKFTGQAIYKYVNAKGDTFNIKMRDFNLVPIKEQGKVKKNEKPRMETTAHGDLPEDLKISVGPGFNYKGMAVLFATRPQLELSGFVKPIFETGDSTLWVRYNHSGEDTTAVKINFETAETPQGLKPSAGIHLDDDGSLYITCITDKKNADDQDFFLPSGTFYYDDKNNLFKIESLEKKRGEKLSGRAFYYQPQKQEAYIDGPLNFFEENPNQKEFVLTAVGSGTVSAKNKTAEFNTLLMINSKLLDPILSSVAKSMADVVRVEGVETGLGDNTKLFYKIANIIGEQEVKDYEKATLNGIHVSLASYAGLSKTIVLGDVNLKWSSEKKVFYSVGPIGVSHMGKTEINGLFEGFLEIGTDIDLRPIVRLFIKASRNVWLYIDVAGNRVTARSSEDAFNNLVLKKTSLTTRPWGYGLAPADVDEALGFVNKFRKDNYGIETPYNMEEDREQESKSEPNPLNLEPAQGQEQKTKPKVKKEDKEGF